MVRVARILAVVASLTLTLGPVRAQGGADRSDDGRPNIIYILLDDAGYGDFGATGSQAVKTPGFDRLCREGTRFTDHYSGSALCGDSRCVLMTGKSIPGPRDELGADGGNSRTLTDADVTLAEALAQVGYATGGFGNWSLGEAGTPGVPHEQGFQRWFGFLSADHASEHYADWLWDTGRRVNLRWNREGRHNVYVPSLLEREALRFVRDHAEQPFFLYFAATLPHAPYQFPYRDPAADYYRDKPWPAEVRNYAAMVTRTDRTVVRLLDLLDELELTKHTIVLYTSDNGPEPQMAEALDSNGPFRGGKGQLYEGGVRSAMSVRWPGWTPEGAVSDFPWSMADVVPTLCAISGAAAPDGLSGVDVTAALTGKTAAPHPPICWTIADPYQEAVRWGRWKGVRRGESNELEVYDLHDDPGEEHDLAAERPRETRLLHDALSVNRARQPNESK